MTTSAWFDFLTARRRLINEWRTEGKTCTEIALILSMDPGQVWLISQVENDKAVPEDARNAIIDARERGLKALRNDRR